MTNQKELAAYIMDQLAELGQVRNIPMMGGYVFYYKEKVFGGIYESGFMVKDTKAGRAYMPDSEAAPPYKGARPMLPVTILDDRKKLQEMGQIIFTDEKALPIDMIFSIRGELFRNMGWLDT